MAINANHLFEDLDGVKCAVVEKNVSPERVEFLRSLLGFNGYKVIVVGSPPPKTAAAPAASPANTVDAVSAPVPAPPSPVQPPSPATFTVGVTDVTFNSTNAVFGRLLKTPDGHVVTMAYWQQKEKISHDDVPYYEFNLKI
jgi:hypothetical protein